jgi:hypothetical protein
MQSVAVMVITFQRSRVFLEVGMRDAFVSRDRSSLPAFTAGTFRGDGLLCWVFQGWITSGWRGLSMAASSATSLSQFLHHGS